MQPLPQLLYEDLLPTRNYLQNICLVLGEIQRQFLSKNEHYWQYGLEVTMRGITTQEFTVQGQPMRISLDMVRHKVRIGETNWSIEEYAAPELLKNFRIWFESRGVSPTFKEPEYISQGNHFSQQQATAYAHALWWMHRQFMEIKQARQGGVISPLLLYPHHFDLSLVWFPVNDQQQLALGFSTGDTTIAEPYLYFTASPEQAKLSSTPLPKQAYWQSTGFSGAVLPYALLQTSSDQAALLQTYANDLFVAGAALTG